MHAWVAKSLDWCVIQLAARCSRRGQMHAEPGKPPSSLDLEIAPPEWDGQPDLKIAGDGAFQFPSFLRTPAVRNNTVYGRFFRVDDSWAQYPTVILLHGWNADLCYEHLFPRLAALLKREKVNTAMIELPYHMHRRPHQGPVRDFISSDVEAMIQASRQAMADTLALAGWLSARGGGAVGLWGFSLGGWLAGLLAQKETRLRFAVLATPIAQMDRAVAELPFCEPVRRSLAAASTLELQGLNLGTSPLALNPRDVLLLESRHDLFAPAETLERLWRTWGGPDIWRVPHGHISVLLSWPIMTRTARWIRTRAQQKSRPHPGAAA